MGCVSSEWMWPTSTALAARHSHGGRNSKRRSRVKSRRSAGSSVMTRHAATIIASVFV